MDTFSRIALSLLGLVVLIQTCFAGHENILLNQADRARLSNVRLVSRQWDQQRKCSAYEAELRDILSEKQVLTASRQVIFSIMLEILSTNKLPANYHEIIVNDINMCVEYYASEPEQMAEPEAPGKSRLADGDASLAKLASLEKELATKQQENERLIGKLAELQSIVDEDRTQMDTLKKHSEQVAGNGADTEKLLIAAKAEIDGLKVRAAKDQAQIDILMRQSEQAAGKGDDSAKALLAASAEVAKLQALAEKDEEHIKTLRLQADLLTRRDEDNTKSLLAAKTEIADLKARVEKDQALIKTMKLETKKADDTTNLLIVLKDKITHLEAQVKNNEDLLEAQRKQLEQADDTAKSLAAAMAEIEKKDETIKTLNETKAPDTSGNGDEAVDKNQWDADYRVYKSKGYDYNEIDIAYALSIYEDPNAQGHTACYKYHLAFDVEDRLITLKKVKEISDNEHTYPALFRSQINDLEKMNRISNLLRNSGVKRAAEVGNYMWSCFLENNNMHFRFY